MECQFNLQNEKESLVHPTELSENEELVDLSVSGNGETVVTVVETEESDMTKRICLKNCN